MSATYVGVDMAADPAKTGLAVLADAHPIPRLLSVTVGVDDEAIVEAVLHAEKTGVDVPIGWPRAFVEHVSRHAAGADVEVADSGPEWRRTMALRLTDRVLQEETGQRPLSVSTDLIAYPALRYSVIESRLRRAGLDCARDGSGVVAEVYPAAALRLWGMTHRGYKKKTATALREEIIIGLGQRVNFGDGVDACLADDNALDAVIAAVMAREVALGRTRTPVGEEVAVARQEGWIHVPNIQVP